ncbi:Putative non-heme bromoperoxidase BpoC [Actinosynnema sp. ALI-1.44]
MRHVSVNDTRVHYELDGSGPALTLVHGTGGDADKVFGHVTGHFSGSRTVIRPNLSGSGATVDDGRPLSVDLLADQVTAATRDAVPGPVDLLGFSLGAAVAAAVAARHPELVRRLVLVAGWSDTTGPRDRFYFETWRRLLDTDRDLLKRFSALTGYGPAALDHFGHDGLNHYLADPWPPAGIARQIDLGRDLDIRPLLPAIQAPTLVIGFGRDAMVPVEGSHRLHEQIAGSRFAEIPDQGHMDWFVRPGPLLELVDDFLDHTPVNRP